jgi:hypothetical protein
MDRHGQDGSKSIEKESNEKEKQKRKFGYTSKRRRETGLWVLYVCRKEKKEKKSRGIGGLLAYRWIHRLSFVNAG